VPGFPLLPSTKKARRLLPASHGAMLSLFYEGGNRAAWIAAAIIAVLFFYAVIYAFPNARQVAMQQQRDAIERENRAFCEKYGRLFGTREHTLCAEDLEDIRANERRRTLDTRNFLTRYYDRTHGAITGWISVRLFPARIWDLPL
jgi:hypothetical protein